MGKQNNNFEYFKPQSDRDGLFVPSDSESEDCKDSDSKAMFTLPKRKFVRKKMLRRYAFYYYLCFRSFSQFITCEVILGMNIGLRKASSSFVFLKMSMFS